MPPATTDRIRSSTTLLTAATPAGSPGGPRRAGQGATSSLVRDGTKDSQPRRPPPVPRSAAWPHTQPTRGHAGRPCSFPTHPPWLAQSRRTCRRRTQGTRRLETPSLHPERCRCSTSRAHPRCARLRRCGPVGTQSTPRADPSSEPGRKHERLPQILARNLLTLSKRPPEHDTRSPVTDQNDRHVATHDASTF